MIPTNIDKDVAIVCVVTFGAYYITTLIVDAKYNRNRCVSISKDSLRLCSTNSATSLPVTNI